jgi:hypothetical protein
MILDIKREISNLCEKMTQAGYETFRIDRLNELVDALHGSGVKTMSNFRRKLSERVANKQDYMDIFVEGQFAVTLAKNGFSEIMLECRDEGPDIEAIYNHQTICFEVTRRRYEENEWAESFEPNHVKPDSSQRIVSKIQDKLKQFRDGEINIVVFWSSTMRVMSGEITSAFSDIQHDIDADYKLYRKLSGILFTEMEGYNISSLKQYYLCKNNKASKPLGSRLAKKLESLHSDLKEMQRHRRDIKAAYKRPYGTSI